MDYRKTKIYKELTMYLATGLAEGFEEGTEEEQLSAWQWLVDTGTAWKLQGFFGRTATALIEQGVILPAGQRALTKREAKKRLEYLRHELRSECISYGELAELQSLARYIDKDDVELREAAGIPE